MTMATIARVDIASSFTMRDSSKCPVEAEIETGRSKSSGMRARHPLRRIASMDAHDRHTRDELLGKLGFSSWRPGQREAVEAALEGRDSLIVMPTGGGKSLCYQLPGLATEDLTIVVSPLIALMQRPVAAADRRRAPGGDDLLGDERRGGAGGARAGARRRGADRLLLAGALRLDRLPRRARAAAHRPARRRRGALRLGVGARLPPRLPAPARDRRAARPADGDGLHGDGDQGGRGARSSPASDCASRSQVRSGFDRPNLSFDVVRAGGQGLEGAAAGAARRRASPTRRTARRSSTAAPARDTDEVAQRPARRAACGRSPTTPGWRPRTAAPPSAASWSGEAEVDRRHQRLRHGRRQGRRALGLAHGDPDQPRGLLPGGRARGPRRAAGEGGAAGDEGRPRPAGPLQRAAQRRPRAGDRPRARLARLPHDQGLHLLRALPAAQRPRPLRRPRGRPAAGRCCDVCDPRRAGCPTRRRSRCARRGGQRPRPRRPPTSPRPTRRCSSS